MPRGPAPRVHQAYATMLIDANGNIRDALGEESTMREDSLRGLSPSYASATGFDPDFVRKTIADNVTPERLRAGSILQWQMWVGLWLRYDPDKPLPQEVVLKTSRAEPFLTTIQSVQVEAGDPARARMKGRFMGPIHPASDAEKTLLREPKNSAIAIQEVYEVEAVVQRPSLRTLKVRVRRGMFTRPEGKQVSSSVDNYVFDWAKATVGAGVCPAPPPPTSSASPFLTPPKADPAAPPPVGVSIQAAGIVVAIDGADLAPGCDKPGPGPTVPARAGEAIPFDADALSRCAAKVAKAKPNVVDYTIRAEPDVPFHTIIAVMDALRPSGLTNPMFQPSSGRFPTPCEGKLPPIPRDLTPTKGITVIVSRSQIILVQEAKAVVPLPSREKLVSAGVDAAYKRCGANDYLIMPLRDAVGRKAAGAPGGAEAAVIVDADSPYRLLLEVLFTMGQAGVGKYELMTLNTAR
jgi:biopolymer transport protein ExbD